jgi:hypothetical protein
MRIRKDRDPGLTAGAIADLAAIDAALAGDEVTDDRLELAALAMALRDGRAAPAEEFTARLDRRAEAGFAESPPGAPRGARRRLGPLRPLPAALAAAACLFIAVAAALSSGVLSAGDGGSGNEPRSVARSNEPLALPEAGSAPLPSVAADQAAGGESARSQAGSSAPSGVIVPLTARPHRKVERSATLALSVKRDQIEDVADAVIRTTDRHGGFVTSSNVTDGGAGTGATIELRVPSAQLPAAIADLSKLGHVRSRSQTSLDITARFSSPRRRLIDAEAERRGLLRQLANATTANETASIRTRLRFANGRIDRAHAELRRLQSRVSYSAVSVAVEPARRSQGSAAGAWSAADSLHDALSVLGTVLGVVLLVAAVALPVAIVLLLALLAYRLYVARARGRVLDV